MRVNLKRFILFAIGFLLVSSFSFSVYADTLDSASNKFFTNNNINETLDAQSDVYAIGNNLKFAGKVEADILAAGNNITIETESVGGSIRVAGATILINSNVERNINAVAASVEIKEGTKAKGIYVASGDVNFNGEAEDLFVNADTVTINGTVTGNVKVNCSKLIIGENARVDGTFEVRGEEEPIILGDFDSSKITFDKIITDYDNESLFAGINIAGKIISLITAIIFCILITLFCSRYNNRACEKLEHRGWLPFLIGFATLIVLPIAAVLLCITIVGIPISVISLIIYGILIYLAPVFTGIILGRFILKNMNEYLSAIIFTLIVKIITFIPYVGGVSLFICVLLSLGVFIQNTFEAINDK